MSFGSFTPQAFLSGSVALAVLWGISMFSGFEVTAIFREETKDPSRTVPRATYIVVALIAILYSVTAWLFIQSFGESRAVTVAAEDSAGSMLTSMGQFGGRLLVDVATVLVATSVFATVLTGHNVVARYLYNLSSDGVIPRGLAAVHATQGSPYRASVVTTVLCALLIVPFAMINVDPAGVYPIYTGVASYVLFIVLLLTSLSIPLYMNRNHRGVSTVWHTKIAPAIAAIGFAIGLYLATANITVLVSGSTMMAYGVLIFIYVLFGVGMAMAQWHKRNNPAVYARIGRQ
jgi:Amino acid transporters